MGDINRWHGSGRLTHDPEVRMTGTGTKIVTFGMCCNDRIQNPTTGNWEDRPNFIDVTVFGNRCDFLCQRLAKGKRVYVEGRLRFSQWEKDGQKRSKLEVVADEIDFELPPLQQQGGYQTYGQGVAPAQQPQYQQQYAPQPQYQPQQYAQPQYQQQYAPHPQYQQPAPQQYAPQPTQAPQGPPQQAQRPQYQQPAQAPAQAPQKPPQPPAMDDMYDEDIPF